jgi:F1F0 ATPase subunit 2
MSAAGLLDHVGVLGHAGLAGEFAAGAGALGAGLFLGAIFFGGLWWTVRRGLGSGQPAIWFGLSALVRMAIAFAGFYFFAHDGLPSLAACLVGFLSARMAITRLTRHAH